MFCFSVLTHSLTQFVSLLLLFISVYSGMHARTNLLTQSVRVRKCVRFCEICFSLMFCLLCCFCFSECTHVRGGRGGGMCEDELYLIPFVSIQCTRARNPHSLAQSVSVCNCMRPSGWLFVYVHLFLFCFSGLTNSLTQFVSLLLLFISVYSGMHVRTYSHSQCARLTVWGSANFVCL